MSTCEARQRFPCTVPVSTCLRSAVTGVLGAQALGGTEAETARAQLANELRKLQAPLQAYTFVCLSTDLSASQARLRSHQLAWCLQAELTKSRQVAASATRSAEECKVRACGRITPKTFRGFK